MVSVKMVSLLFLVDYLTVTNRDENQAICPLANKMTEAQSESSVNGMKFKLIYWKMQTATCNKGVKYIDFMSVHNTERSNQGYTSYNCEAIEYTKDREIERKVSY